MCFFGGGGAGPQSSADFADRTNKAVKQQVVNKAVQNQQTADKNTMRRANDSTYKVEGTKSTKKSNTTAVASGKNTMNALNDYNKTNKKTILGSQRVTKTQQYMKRWGDIKDERSSFFGHWQELSDYILPRRGRFLASKRNDGSKKNGKIIDSTGSMAVRTLSAGMMSGITSPARPWFRLATPESSLMEQSEVKQWLFSVEKLMRDVFSRSNLYNSLQTVYEELSVFGTGAMLISEDFDDVIRCYPFTVGEYGLAQSHRLQVDTFYREFQLTVEQMVGQFGIENCSDAVRTQFREGKLDAYIEVLHIIEPNSAREYDKKDNQNMPYHSCYVEKASKNDRKLSDKGFEEFPVLAPRWHVTGVDIYGRSPGMDVLGDVKALQIEQKRKAQGIDKMVNPPLQAPSSLRGQSASVLPGGVTYVDTMQGAQGGFRPTYEVNPRLGELAQDIAETQARIQQGFYSDLFQMMMMSDRRQITAREIDERHEEKLLMLGPVLERLHTELLNPLIDRTFNIMARNNLLPPAPEELSGVTLKVEYISMMAQAQKAVGTGAIERLAGFVGNMAAVKPDVLDKFDADQTVDEYAEMLGVPPKIVVSDDIVQQTRQARAEQQQQMQQMEQAAQGAQAAKVLADADTGGQNALTDVIGGLQ